MTTPETTDLAGTAIERLTPYLPGVAADAAGLAEDAPAAQLLYATIAGRLRALDESAALAEFVRQPGNNSLVRRLLATAVREDPAFAGELAAVVSVTPARMTAGAADNTNPAGPDFAPGPKRSKGLFIGLAVLVVVAVLGCLAGRSVLGELRGSGGLTGQSSCDEFLRAPADEQSRAIQEIGLSKGISDLDSPLALPAITHFCTAQPAARLGDVIGRFHD